MNELYVMIALMIGLVMLYDNKIDVNQIRFTRVENLDSIKSYKNEVTFYDAIRYISLEISSYFLIFLNDIIFWNKINY